MIRTGEIDSGDVPGIDYDGKTDKQRSIERIKGKVKSCSTQIDASVGNDIFGEGTLLGNHGVI